MRIIREPRASATARVISMLTILPGILSRRIIWEPQNATTSRRNREWRRKSKNVWRTGESSWRKTPKSSVQYPETNQPRIPKRKAGKPAGKKEDGRNSRAQESVAE